MSHPESPKENPLGSIRTIEELVDPELLERAGLASPLTYFLPENAENVAYYLGDLLETGKRVVVTERRSKKPEGIRQLWGAATISDEHFLDEEARRERFFSFVRATVVRNEDLGNLIELTIMPPRKPLGGS